MTTTKVMCYITVATLVFAGAGCAPKKEAALTPATRDAFTGGAMPEEAKIRMREAQAKAMAKAGAGAAPEASPAAPK